MRFGKCLKFMAAALFLMTLAIVGMSYAAHGMGMELPGVLAWFLNDNHGMTLMLGEVVIAPFPVNPEDTAMAIAYRNAKLVADKVLPRRKVGKQNFKWKVFAKGAFLTIPETLVGRTGKPNQITIGYTEVDDSTFDHGLDNPIPRADIDNAAPGYSPTGVATIQLVDTMELRREKAVYDLVTDASQYGSNNKITLSGTDQLSDTTSDIIGIFQDAMDACVMKANKVTMGNLVWKYVRKHPALVGAAYQNSGTKGLISRRALAEILELDEDGVSVGEAWVNTAMPGQTPVLERVWGNQILFHYDNPIATPQMGLTFGMTAQWGDRAAGQIVDADVGVRGGVRQRVYESTTEKIIAPDCAYLISDAVATD